MLACCLGVTAISSQAFGQATCGTDCYPAKSCAPADVQAAVDAALANAGGTVLIPDPASGICDFTKPVVVDATKKPIHIRGQSEQTTRIRALGQAFSVDGAKDVAWEISDLELSDEICSGSCDTIIGIGGAGTNGRAHHLRFDTTGVFLRLFRTSGSAHPLIDHVTVRGTTPSEFLTADGTNWLGWKDPVDLGSTEAVFVEDCDIEFTESWEGRPFDGENGGRMVVRHNRIKNHMLGSHGFDSGFGASMFSVVAYANAFTFADDVTPWTSKTWSRFTHFRGGTGLLYDNTFAVAADIWIGGTFDLAIYRTPTDSGGNESWQPCNGTAYRMCSNIGRDWTIVSGDHPYNCVTDQDCADKIGAGTTCKWKVCSASRMELCEADSDCPVGETCTSNLDGAAADGYPCFMQPGYATEMHRTPWYEWKNTWSGGQGGSACAAPPCNVDFGANVSQLVKGRDYFNDVPQGTTLPASCTPDDAFWMASESTLYRCEAANAYTAYYKEVPYPHPLQTSGTPGNDGGPVAPVLDATAGDADERLAVAPASEAQGGGCGCRTAGAPSTTRWPLVVFGLAALIRRRRAGPLT
jgi:MYXO-CTERM domain-containing protein